MEKASWLEDLQFRPTITEDLFTIGQEDTGRRCRERPKPDKTEGPVLNEKQRVSMHLWAAETEDPLPAFPDQPDPVDKVESTEPCRERPKPDKTEGPVLNEKQ
jgi:hypothetical protein